MQAQTTQTSSVANPILRQELLKRLEQDQAIRDEWIGKGNDTEVLKRLEAIDSDNTARMKAIVKQYGWPSPKLVGEDGTFAAFMIVQHSDPAFRKEMLPLVRDAHQSGELEGQDYALLLDRVRGDEGKPQVYGTQAEPVENWKGEEPVLKPIEDEANVDKRRKEVGLPPLSEYIKSLKATYFPKKKKE